MPLFADLYYQFTLIKDTRINSQYGLLYFTFFIKSNAISSIALISGKYYSKHNDFSL